MLVLRVFKVLKVLRVQRVQRLNVSRTKGAWFQSSIALTCGFKVLRVLRVLRVQRLNVSRTCGACFIASLFHGLRRVFEFLSRFRLNDCYLSRLTPQTIVSYLGYTSNDSYKVSVAKRLQNVYLCYTLAIPLQKLWKYHRAVNPTSNVTFFFSMAM